MPRCIDALTHYRIHGSTRPVLAVTLFLLSSLAGLASAQNPVLRDVEVRSFIGEPLSLRIALAASTEAVSGALCQSVIDSDRRDNALRSSDLVLTMVELRETRYLQVRSRTAFNDPIARFSLRIGCPGEPVVDREFTALLEPPPFVALPVLPAASPARTTADTSGDAPLPAKPGKSSVRAKPVIPASGSAATVEGDTLARLAKSIHPKNRARQRQYIAALRELNPHLAALADSAPLPPGTPLALPDLHTLSGILPGPSTEQLRTPPSSTPISSAPIPAKKTPATVKAPPQPKPDTVTKSSSVTPAPVSAKTTEPKVALPPVKPAKPPSAQPPEVTGSGFQLRLSGMQMDLTRSRNVTDEQRNILREKQLMLDSDDQIAAFLSLKNTVKQLEQRLNDLQLKTSTTTSVPAPVAVAPPQPSPSPPASAPAAPSVVSTAPPVAPKITVAEPSPVPAPIAAAPTIATTEKPTPPVEKTVIATKPAKPASAEPVSADSITDYLPSPLMSGGIVAVLVLLLSAWAWSRREPQPRRRGGSILDDADVEEATSHTRRKKTIEESAHEEKVYDLEDDEAADAEAAGHDEATVRIQSDPVWTNDRTDDSAGQPANDHDHPAHSQVDAPVIFEDTPASFEVDASPATTVDFLVGMDEKLPEDRVRRLQYMHERYPELQTNTVSIDDADSVINAARLYYDESDKGSGADKACELLTFAVEERPQQVRYWLAQFEIFRLENRVADFSGLASKFHVLFSHTPSWPKVRHIGHELDPGNTLFAGGSAPLASEMRFDPIAENWLNAPTDFTSDALMSDLRQALLDDHLVKRTDFESITARLTASAA